MNKKQIFLNGFDNPDVHGVSVYVEIKGYPELEHIMTPKENLKTKKKYYDRVLNDELVFKNKKNKEITRIAAYQFWIKGDDDNGKKENNVKSNC